MAKHLGVKKAIGLVDKVDYIPLTQTIGLDSLINKKLIAANNITRFIRKSEVVALSTLEGIDADIMEYVAQPNSPITKKPIKDLNFPKEAIIGDEPHYGINTGFGTLAEVAVPRADLRRLQRNLVLSHAAGVGAPLSPEETRALVLLRANVLAKGYSGVREETLDLLVEMLGRGVTPVVPERGSVGASGDLAPLAHLALVVIGEGEAWVAGPAGTARMTCSRP